MPETTTSEVRTDLLKPWCQALRGFAYSWGGAIPCGRTDELRTQERFGVLYNFCPTHRDPPWWAEQVSRPSLFRRIVARLRHPLGPETVTPIR